MKDVVPELLEAIEKAFKKKKISDKKVNDVLQRIEKGTAELDDGHTYAERLGEILSQALQNNITEDALPDGKLYWNIANGTVRPMLEQNHNLVNETAAQIQKALDQKAGIGLLPEFGDFPEDRVRGLLDKMCTAPDIESARKWLGEPIVNCTEAFFDDFIKANAKAKSDLGYEPRIIRKAAFGCCEWCSKIAGVFPYDEVSGTGSDVFRRHENCRCVVTYDNGKIRQNVWSKEVLDENDVWSKDIQQVTKRERNNNSLIENDVTLDYLKRATPGRGSYVVENGFQDKNNESMIAKWLYDIFGGDIKLLAENGNEGEKNPDYLWNNKLWDLKTVSTENAANSALKKAMLQIKNNPGGAILYYEKYTPNMQLLKKVIDERMKWKHIGEMDVIIKEPEGVHIIRY